MSSGLLGSKHQLTNSRFPSHSLSFFLLSSVDAANGEKEILRVWNDQLCWRCVWFGLEGIILYGKQQPEASFSLLDVVIIGVVGYVFCCWCFCLRSWMRCSSIRPAVTTWKTLPYWRITFSSDTTTRNPLLNKEKIAVLSIRERGGVGVIVWRRLEHISYFVPSTPLSWLDPWVILWRHAAWHASSMIAAHSTRFFEEMSINGCLKICSTGWSPWAARSSTVIVHGSSETIVSLMSVHAKHHWIIYDDCPCQQTFFIVSLMSVHTKHHWIIYDDFPCQQTFFIVSLMSVHTKHHWIIYDDFPCQ